MSMKSQALREPLVRVVKRSGISLRRKAVIRLIAIAMALVVDALFIFFVTGLNPLDVYRAMVQGTFSTGMRFSWAMRDLPGVPHSGKPVLADNPPHRPESS